MNLRSWWERIARFVERRPAVPAPASTTPETESPKSPQLALPEWVYIFVSPHNSMAVMNLQITGRFVSPVLADLEIDPTFATKHADGTANFLPFVPNPERSTGALSPFLMSTINGYRVEYDAELCRHQNFPQTPSRLTGVYAFESLEDCRRASAQYGWDLATVQRFQPENVLRAARINMEIVSLARLAYSRASFSPETIDHLWRSSWSGADTYTFDLPSVNATSREMFTAETLWEWIIDGVLVHDSRVGTGS